MHQKIKQTKEKLYRALDKLIEKKDVSEITVSELCELAQINRTTFYRYYALPNDVLNEHVQHILQTSLENVTHEFSENPVQDAHFKMLVICKSYYENQQLTKIFHKNNNEAYDALKYILKQVRKETSDIEDNVMFIAGGVLYMLSAWALSGFKRKPETIAEILTSQIARFATHTKS